MKSIERILISSCFLGEKVRYDGYSKTLSHPAVVKWQQQKRLIAICPEISGGLSVPRKAAEINAYTNQVITCDGKDVTSEFIAGAKQALVLCQKNKIRFALLKEASPSCGSSQIYDGSFSGKQMPGQGVCAKLLTNHGILVFSEKTIDDLVLLINKLDEVQE